MMLGVMVLSMDRLIKYKKCLHLLGYEVLYHEIYKTVTITCLECGNTITYDYKEIEQ